MGVVVEQVGGGGGGGGRKGFREPRHCRSVPTRKPGR